MNPWWIHIIIFDIYWTILSHAQQNSISPFLQTTNRKSQAAEVMGGWLRNSLWQFSSPPLPLCSQGAFFFLRSSGRKVLLQVIIYELICAVIQLQATSFIHASRSCPEAPPPVGSRLLADFSATPLKTRSSQSSLRIHLSAACNRRINELPFAFVMPALIT